MSLFDLVRPGIFCLDAEKAHGLAIKALKSGLLPAPPAVADSRLRLQVAGLDFPNPVGVAAGFDKNGEVPDALLRLGFGFTEIGTVTPRPQSGNAKPRIFRIVERQGVINRLGFNNDGHQSALSRLQNRARHGGIVGVNVGANKDTADFATDYVSGIANFAGLADYFTINISSPNTPGLRNLQAADALSRLLGLVLAERDTQAKITGKRRPVFLKVAPDLDAVQIDEIAGIARASHAEGGLDGIIATNTTLSRHGVEDLANADEAGGLSGKPLFERSTIILARLRMAMGSEIPVIGVGGIDNAHTAIEKLKAGANLVQLYTGMIYRGPLIAQEINRGVCKELDMRGMANVSDLSGTETNSWAARNLPEEA
ncbi:MAG: quinone-dependent dihydroorotate dehydrogenase [Nitratireductor sp.]|nr:quinone-dependent dihydroorotate dehydrogenase [Nitratireductor sp.]